MSDAADAVAPGAAQRCPLCGGPNGCAMAGGLPDGPCWCTRASFPPALLARVPAALQGRACICARCAGAAVPLDPAAAPPIGSEPG